MPAHGVYCNATAASSRTSRAAISSSSSVGNVAGFGKPPVMESTPGGLPARIAVSSSPPRRRVQRSYVLAMVRQAVQRLAACLRRKDRLLAAADQLRGLEGDRDPLFGCDQQ